MYNYHLYKHIYLFVNIIITYNIYVKKVAD